jgi:hypothetical protein
MDPEVTQRLQKWRHGGPDGGPMGGKWRRGVPKWRPMGGQMGAWGTEMEARGGNGGPEKSKRGAKGTKRINHEAKCGSNGGPRQPKTMQVELKDAKIRHMSAPNQKGCKRAATMQRRCCDDSVTMQRRIDLVFMFVSICSFLRFSYVCSLHIGYGVVGY